MTEETEGTQPSNEVSANELKVGAVIEGTVAKTVVFGAFVKLTPEKDGLLHISKIRALVGGQRVDKVENVLRTGDKVSVVIDSIAPDGKISLSVAE